MTFYRYFSLFFTIIFILTTVQCGGSSSSSSSDGTDLSSLSYPDAVALYTDEGLDYNDKALTLATAHNTFLTLDTTNADVDEMDEALSDFTEALSNYVNAAEDINDLETIAFDDSATSTLINEFLKYQTIDPSGVDSLNSLTNTLTAKKKECEELFAQVPSLPSSPEDFAKLEAAQQCEAEAQALAVSNGFDAAYVSGGGGLVGAGLGWGAVIYMGGTALSGGGLLVITAAGIVGSKAASFIWSSCTSSSSSNLKKIMYADASSDTCAINSGSGDTDSPMTLMAKGSGTLQVFIEGCAPIVMDGLTITSGQTLTVNATCEELDDDIEQDDVESVSDNATSSSETSEAVSCDSIYGLTSTNSPTDPGIDDAVTVTSTTIPPASGCSVTYSMSGTDGYTQSAVLTTDSSGSISFTIPAAGEEGIVDTITITESASSKSSNVTYVF